MSDMVETRQAFSLVASGGQLHLAFWFYYSTVHSPLRDQAQGIAMAGGLISLGRPGRIGQHSLQDLAHWIS